MGPKGSGAWIAGLLAAALIGCGGTPVGTGPSAPHGTVDAGTTSTPPPDAGTDAGTVGTPVPDAGSGGPQVADAGTTSTPPPDAGTDAGTGAPGIPDGGSAEACDGLMPEGALGDPVLMVIEQTDAQDQRHHCIAGTTDGAGNVLGGSQNEYQPHDTRMYFFTPDGTETGSGSGVRFTPFAQANGFLGIDIVGAYGEWRAKRLGGDGALLAEDDSHGLSDTGWAADDPLGGMVVFSAPKAGAPLGKTGILIAYDADLNERWDIPLQGPGPFRALGVDRAGHILLLFGTDSDRSQLRGLWVSHDGTVDGDFFPAGSPDGALSLHPSVGTGLFLLSARGNGHGAWTARFDPGVARAEPVPDWLAAHPDTTLHMVHGGRGYALLPLPGRQVSRCEQTVRIFSSSGESCGGVTFTVDDDACRTGPLSIGWDGTALQLLPASRQDGCVGPHCPCTYRAWPGLFH